MPDAELEFAQLLRKARVEANLTQEELAERAGLSVDAVRRLESGTRRAPYPETVTRLAAALRLRPDQAERLAAIANRARRRGPAAAVVADLPQAREESERMGLPRTFRNVVWIATFAVLLAGGLVLAVLRHAPLFGQERRAAAQAEPAHPLLGASAKKRSAPPALRITTAAECTTDWSEIVANNTHGRVSLISGTGSFAGVGPERKELAVAPNANLLGKVFLMTQNGGATFAVAPFVYTPTWGSAENSWRLVAQWVPDGTNVYSPSIVLKAPQAPGRYAIIFAFELEKSGANVASGTNWRLGTNVWSAGHRLAGLSKEQIQEAQRFGCYTSNWQMSYGVDQITVPADAVTLLVTKSFLDSH
jgi:transcriptional regulator with XRE-family HTH domain